MATRSADGPNNNVEPDDRWPNAETRRHTIGNQRAKEEADGPDREREAEHLGREEELADEVQDQDRVDDVGEEVRQAGRRRDAPQEPLPPDVPEALDDLGSHRWPLALLIQLRLGRGLVATDREHEQRGHDEAQRVDEDGERRRERPDQERPPRPAR